MNVLVVFHEEALGGASRAVLRPLPVLEARGWRFEFWVPTPSRVADVLSAEGRTVHGAPRDIRFSLRSLAEPPAPRERARSVAAYLRRLHALLREQRFDIVHANTVLTLPEAWIAHRAGVPTLMYVHEWLPAGPKGRAAAWLTGRTTDTTIATSHAVAARLPDAWTVHAGIVPPAWAPRVPGERLVVGALGTICHRKGSELFVEVAAAARARGVDAEFRLVGPLADGPERPWAAEVVRRAEAEGVRWLGPVETWTALRAMDVLLVPSRNEPFGLAVLEAMIAGVPIVAHASGGIPEVIAPGTGVLVPAEDPGAMAGAVAELLADPERRARLAAAARARAERVFTLQRQADGMESAYRAALEAAGRRGARPALPDGDGS